MASNPLAVPLLVGLGIAELSGTPGMIPVVKEIVRALDAADLAADAREALRAGSVEAVQGIASARLRDAGLLEHPDIGSWLQTNLRGLRAEPAANGGGSGEPGELSSAPRERD